VVHIKEVVILGEERGRGQGGREKKGRDRIWIGKIKNWGRERKVEQ
jgi:hypothetical protein